jgi:hypothetical protein
MRTESFTGRCRAIDYNRIFRQRGVIGAAMDFSQECDKVALGFAKVGLGLLSEDE